MAGMGPPPKPAGTRARRNAAPQTTTLSAKGRGNRKPPRWPLRPDRLAVLRQATAEMTVERLREQLNATRDRRKIGRLERQLDVALAEADVVEQELADQARLETELWTELWSTPQAAMWEKNGWSREVALYVRCTLLAEDGDLKAAAEARQRSDRLGLNPLAMLRLRWEIERTEDAEERGKARRSRVPKAPAKPAADPRSVLRAVN